MNIFGSVCAKHPELMGERYIKNRNCLKCAKERSAQWEKKNRVYRLVRCQSTKTKWKIWREKNRETIMSEKRQWYKANRQITISRAKKWRELHPEGYKQSARKWRRNNRHKIYVKGSLRRAKKLSATPVWANQFFIEEIYDLAQRRTKVMGYKWHVDHIVPLKSDLVCGLHVENNLQVIPAVQNYSKSNRHWPDMPIRS